MFSRIDDPANPKSLSDQSVYDIVRDREGGFWVSTYFGGINYIPLNLKPFEHYFPLNQPGSISGKAISRFCEDDDGNIWIGTEDAGLNFFNAQTLQTESYQPPGDRNSISYHSIHALLLDNGKLWIGTFSRGIDVFDLKRKTFRNYQHRRYDQRSVCNNTINILFKNSNDVIYVGTDWGLSQYDRISDSFSMVEEIGPHVHVFDILEDSLGFMWFATYNAGVFRFDKHHNEWKHFMHSPEDPFSLCGNSVISLFEDADHTVWLGTEGGGLCSFNRSTGNFIPFDPDGKLLPNQVINAIQQDEFGNLWISTNAGLVQINTKNTKNKRVFTKADGLQSNQFNFRSSLKARDGKMYFGGINGFNAFYPKDFSENGFIPKVRISDFRIFSKQVRVGENGSPLFEPVYVQKDITLRHDMNTFSFTFVSLSYQAPEKNQYAFFMEGVDKGWNLLDNGSNTAYYTNLPPGNYTFMVKGSNNDGLWNQEEAVVAIRILPPIWKSRWAFMFYLSVVVGLVVWYYNLRTRRLMLLQNERLRVFQEQKEKESYLSKINFFTNLAHEIRTPLTLIKLPLERIINLAEENSRTKGYLSTIERNTDYLLSLINQLLDFRKTEEVEFKLRISSHNISGLLRYLYLRFKHTAEISNICLNLNLPAADFISGVDSEAFTKIISNLLSNALKYAHSAVEIKLEVTDHSFDVRICDDGKGIKQEEKHKIFEAFYQSDHSKSGTGIGLAFAKVLAEKHQGSLTHDDNPSGGSIFILRLSRLVANGPYIPDQKNEIIAIDPKYVPEHFTTEVKNVKSEPLMKLLLVEDNPELLKLTSDYFSDFYEIHLALNGKDALALLSEHAFDIVVSDLMMPEMDGYQLCESIKSDARYCHIPFVLLTAKTNVEAKIRGLEYGSDAYMEKPFSLEHLHTQISNLLSSRQKLRELFASSPLFPIDEMVVSQKDKEFIEQLNTKIEERMADVSFSIDTLAENMNMSRSNFYRKLKSISGMSPNDYLKIIRLKRAAELLLKQDYRINEVYEQTGFNSSSYFAKCFKEQFGMLPREFVLKAGEGTI